MWRKPSFLLFVLALLLVFGTFYVPFQAKMVYIWGPGILGSGLSFWTLRQAQTGAQRFLSVFLGVSFLAFAYVLSVAFQLFE